MLGGNFSRNPSWYFGNISVVWLYISSYTLHSNGFDRVRVRGRLL